MYWLREHYIPSRPTSKVSFWKEIRVFVFLFVFVFLWLLVFSNLNLFAANFFALFSGGPDQVAPLENSVVYQNKNIASIVDNAEVLDKEIQTLLRSYQKSVDVRPIATSVDEILQWQLVQYDFSFNTVPPVNRIIVPSIGLDVPLITSEHMSQEDFIKWRFEPLLDQWIVKYPTTPAPGQEGNTLLFGHTSYEVWKKNPYGTIFKDLPKLKDGTLIQVLREGNMYEFKVVDLFIVTPKQVPAQYMTYHNAWGSYITLMWCYPLGTDKKRILAVAKLID